MAVLGGIALRTVIPYIKLFLAWRNKESQLVFDYYFILTAMFAYPTALGIVGFFFLSPPPTVPFGDAFLVSSAFSCGFVVNEILNRSIGHQLIALQITQCAHTGHCLVQAIPTINYKSET